MGVLDADEAERSGVAGVKNVCRVREASASPEGKRVCAQTERADRDGTHIVRL